MTNRCHEITKKLDRPPQGAKRKFMVLGSGRPLADQHSRLDPLNDKASHHCHLTSLVNWPFFLYPTTTCAA
jgi:hypothetical protein